MAIRAFSGKVESGFPSRRGALQRVRRSGSKMRQTLESEIRLGVQPPISKSPGKHAGACFSPQWERFKADCNAATPAGTDCQPHRSLTQVLRRSE